MQFATPSSPHNPLPNDVQKVMLQVLLALVPGAFAMGFYFGIGVWINIWIACAAAIGFEALMLRLRGRSLAPLGDLSALVTAVLFGLAVPPLLPWWMTVLGAAFAIGGQWRARSRACQSVAVGRPSLRAPQAG